MVAIHSRQNQLKKNWLSTHLTIVVIIVSGVITSRFAADLFPVRQILLEGQFQYINPQQLQSTLDQATNRGLLMIDLTRLQTELQRFPWIKSVDIERIWPDSIRINVIEKTPYLRLGSDQIISLDGAVFSPDSTQVFSDLPLLTIDATFTPELFQSYREMEYLLALNHYELRQFQVNKLGEWFLELSGNIQIALGHQHPISSFKRFIAILPGLGRARINKMKSIDLRYENGFAISYAD